MFGRPVRGYQRCDRVDLLGGRVRSDNGTTKPGRFGPPPAPPGFVVRGVCDPGAIGVVSVLRVRSHAPFPSTYDALGRREKDNKELLKRKQTLLTSALVALAVETSFWPGRPSSEVPGQPPRVSCPAEAESEAAVGRACPLGAPSGRS